MRKVSKIIIILTLIITFIVIPQKAFASEEYLNPIHQNHSIQKPGGNKVTGSGNGTQSIQKQEQDTDIANWDIGMSQDVPEKVIVVVGFIIKFLRNISIILTVLVITILGIKYMIGSVQEKADYKKAYVNIIIGVVLVTMITSIVDFIFSMTQY